MSKSKGNKPSKATPVFVEPKSVNIKKANNGFVVSTYTDRGDKIAIAKNSKEMLKITKNMLK